MTEYRAKRIYQEPQNGTPATRLRWKGYLLTPVPRHSCWRRLLTRFGRNR